MRSVIPHLLRVIDGVLAPAAAANTAVVYADFARMLAFASWARVAGRVANDNVARGQ